MLPELVFSAWVATIGIAARMALVAGRSPWRAVFLCVLTGPVGLGIVALRCRRPAQRPERLFVPAVASRRFTTHQTDLGTLALDEIAEAAE